MIVFKLSQTSERLKPYFRELLLYSGISDVVVEVGKNKTSTKENTIFLDETKYTNSEELLAGFALSIYNEDIHKNFSSSSYVSLVYQYGESCSREIASVIEKAIDPVLFFALERVNYVTY